MKVLVAIDGSPFSERVMEAVCQRHWQNDTEFGIITVVEPLPLVDWDSDAWADVVIDCHSRRMHSADKLCAEARKKLMSAHPKCIVHYEVREGDAREKILEAATDWSADKIMIGSHGRSACPHFLLGSVSREVARSSKCSVEVVRPKRKKHKAIA